MKAKRKDTIFQTVPDEKISRNLFDLSHEVKMTGKFGYLYPVMTLETLPGETFRWDMRSFIRFAPMLAPIMHRVSVTAHAFFVPNRILSKPWEEFITGGQSGDEEPVLPFFTPAGLTGEESGNYVIKGTLLNHLGLPAKALATVADSTEQFSALPVFAYFKIWSDYYRDPNFHAEIEFPIATEGNVAPAIADMLALNGVGGKPQQRGWQKDYFTSALESAQRGTQVLMPFDATVTYKDVGEVVNNLGLPPGVGDITSDVNSDVAIGGVLGNIHNIESISSGSVTINDFRTALAVQAWMEATARGGARYTEVVRVQFGQKVADYRLQRAEYLGGGKAPVQISEVLTTADTEVADVPVGDMYGHGLSVGNSNSFTYRCEEHGFIMVILSVMPDTAYWQGLPRMWTRRTKFDYAWPKLAHLGEQEVISKEIFYSYQAANDAANNTVFGYLPRFAEYKYMPDRITGDFTDTLEFWHLGRRFLARPLLGAGFTTMNDIGENLNSSEEPYNRIFAVQDGTDYLWMQLYHKVTAKRPLPYFGVPRLVG